MHIYFFILRAVSAEEEESCNKARNQGVEIIGIFLSYNPFLGPIKFSGGLQPRGNYEKSLPKASRADEIVLIDTTHAQHTQKMSIFRRVITKCENSYEMR